MATPSIEKSPQVSPGAYSSYSFCFYQISTKIPYKMLKNGINGLGWVGYKPLLFKEFSSLLQTGIFLTLAS